jgi:F-type H+-transporting ATPase subunit a
VKVDMSAGFKIWDLAHSEYLHENPHVGAASVGVAALLLSAVAYKVFVPKHDLSRAPDEVFVPPANLGIRNLFDMAGSFVQGVARDVIGHHYQAYMPILTFIFVWTLMHNLLGAIAGFGATTDNLNTTLAMGAAVFIYYNYQGVKAHGFRYLEHFTGHLKGVLLLILGPIMFVIETISHFIRPVTLGVRLRSNIFADHVVYGIFTELLGSFKILLTEKLGVIGTGLGFIFQVVGPVPIMLLGILVCVIQAFVFTLLTSIYIGIATAHEEH